MPAKKLIDGVESSKHPLYWTWANMKARCSNKNAKNFDIYGGRGIKVCDKWMVFTTFVADMGNKPSASHTLDRIDSNGNYEASNCRWADSRTQARNTSRVKLIEFNGQSMCVPHWAEVFGLNKATLDARIRAGWSMEKALSKKPNYSRRS